MLTRWSPFSTGREVSLLRRLTAHWLDEPFLPGRWDSFPFSPFNFAHIFPTWSSGQVRELISANFPAIDLYEEGDQFVVKASLPGVRLEEVEVQEKNGFLTIRAERQAEAEQERNGWRVRRRSYGAWQRTLRLPAAVDVNRAQAVLDDGVLTVTLPKREARPSLLHRINRRLPKLKLPVLNKNKRRIRISHY